MFILFKDGACEDKLVGCVSRENSEGEILKSFEFLKKTEYFKNDELKSYGNPSDKCLRFFPLNKSESYLLIKVQEIK